MITLTLKPNKEYLLTADSETKTARRDYLIMDGENGVTEFKAVFPESYKDWAKRIDFVTAAGGVCMTELEGFTSTAERTEITFVLPGEVAVKGYTEMTVRAFKDGKVFVWQPVALLVEGGRKGQRAAVGNPDLITLAYSYANEAREIVLKLTQPPDYSLADVEGTPEVAIMQDGRLQFIAIKGRPGKDGTDGKDGRNGTDGKDGTNGKDGRDGIDGYIGKDGKDGLNGVISTEDVSHFAFSVDQNGHLLLHFLDGAAPPAASVNADGHLIVEI